MLNGQIGYEAAGIFAIQSTLCIAANLQVGLLVFIIKELVRYPSSINI